MIAIQIGSSVSVNCSNLSYKTLPEKAERILITLTHHHHHHLFCLLFILWSVNTVSIAQTTIHYTVYILWYSADIAELPQKPFKDRREHDKIKIMPYAHKICIFVPADLLLRAASVFMCAVLCVQFCQLSRDGEAYHDYCLNYSKAMSYLEQLRKKEDFCEFEKVTTLMCYATTRPRQNAITIHNNFCHLFQMLILLTNKINLSDLVMKLSVVFPTIFVAGLSESL